MLIIPFLSFLVILAMFGARTVELLDAWIGISGAVTVGFGAYFIYIMQKTIAN